jgi:hypothetical protein
MFPLKPPIYWQILRHLTDFRVEMRGVGSSGMHGDTNGRGMSSTGGPPVKILECLGIL